MICPQQESYDSLPNMVIILNPNGTVNEELMLAHGMNLETIKVIRQMHENGMSFETQYINQVTGFVTNTRLRVTTKCGLTVPCRR
jgi:hypothetical protein